MRLVILAMIAVALMLTVIPALCSQKIVSLRDYNVTLDFGDKDVIVEPMASSSTMDTILHHIKFRGENETDYATIYLYEYQATPTLDLRDRLWSFMKSYCTMVDTKQAEISGMDGYIGSGNARVAIGFSKQVCYGGIVALPSGTLVQRDFVIMAHFTDKSLNERLVKTAQIKYAGKVVKI